VLFLLDGACAISVPLIRLFRREIASWMTESMTGAAPHNSRWITSAMRKPCPSFMNPSPAQGGRPGSRVVAEPWTSSTLGVTQSRRDSLEQRSRERRSLQSIWANATVLHLVHEEAATWRSSSPRSSHVGSKIQKRVLFKPHSSDKRTLAMRLRGRAHRIFSLGNSRVMHDVRSACIGRVQNRRPVVPGSVRCSLQSGVPVLNADGRIRRILLKPPR